MSTLKEDLNTARKSLTSAVKDAFILFLIATIIAIIVNIISELVPQDGIVESSLKKIAETFTLIAAIAIMGAVYIYLSTIKDKAQENNYRPLPFIKLGPHTYVPQTD